MFVLQEVNNKMERKKNMKTFIYINKKNNIDNQKFEVVETKGKGHQIIYAIH